MIYMPSSTAVVQPDGGKPEIHQDLGENALIPPLRGEADLLTGIILWHFGVSFTNTPNFPTDVTRLSFSEVLNQWEGGCNFSIPKPFDEEELPPRKRIMELPVHDT
ncbi:hypothetical protein NPIL_303801 [Nephila pilipes]|uniref:Uncharacterized protein n=1 Tax=Nephila pilipes TaxID=299642 RepID=A0A8X6N8C8_NEPPI|nr:hypothetical protein NPIL_303801 [Nephila pilipes]